MNMLVGLIVVSDMYIYIYDVYHDMSAITHPLLRASIFMRWRSNENFLSYITNIVGMHFWEMLCMICVLTFLFSV